MIRGENIRGSVAIEEERTVVFLNGCEGEYEIYLGDRLLCGALSNHRGRIIKKLDADLNNGGEIVIKKDGRTEGYVKICVDESINNIIETEKEEPLVMGKNRNADYGFCSDLSSVIEKFKEQIKRLEEEEVLKKEDVDYINEDVSVDKKEMKVYPDYLWNLPLKDIGFPSNPFLIYSQLKYKHILLRESENAFTVGAADVYDEENVKAAAENGFFCFETKEEGEVKNGDAGYWLADILKN